MAREAQRQDVANRGERAPVRAPDRARSSALQDGFEAGAIGAVTVAAWFLLIDALSGRPFFTPSLLGTALTRGVAAAVESREIAVGMVYAYTGIHFALFILFGILVASLVIQYERTPAIGYLLVLAAVIFELGFLILILGFAEPLLAEIPWWAVLTGNLLALLAMGAYFRARHPELRSLRMLVD
ncbi:MAG: hypothetical protein ABR599_01770 [Gemmatimonadota bacterium]